MRVGRRFTYWSKPWRNRQSQTPECYVVGNIGSADCAKINRAERPQNFEAVLRHPHPVFFVVVRAPGKGFYLQLKTPNLFCERPENFETRIDNFGADAIPWDSCNCVLSHSYS